MKIIIKYILLLVIILICVMCRQKYDLKYVLSEGIISGVPEHSENIIYIKITSMLKKYDTLHIIISPGKLYDIVTDGKTIHGEDFIKMVKKCIEQDRPLLVDSVQYNILQQNGFKKDGEIHKLYREKGYEYLYNKFVDDEQWICKFQLGEIQDSVQRNKIDNVLSILQKYRYHAYWFYDESEYYYGLKIACWEK